MDDKTLDKYIEEWISKREKDPEHFIICGGERYYIGCEDTPARGRGRGFGGDTFYIRYLDSNKVVKSTNLYHNGDVPERWKGRLPDTVEFISKTEYEKITDGNESTG